MFFPCLSSLHFLSPNSISNGHKSTLWEKLQSVLNVYKGMTGHFKVMLRRTVICQGKWHTVPSGLSHLRKCEIVIQADRQPSCWMLLPRGWDLGALEIPLTANPPPPLPPSQWLTNSENWRCYLTPMNSSTLICNMGILILLWDLGIINVKCIKTACYTWGYH